MLLNFGCFLYMFTPKNLHKNFCTQNTLIIFSFGQFQKSNSGFNLITQFNNLALNVINFHFDKRVTFAFKFTSIQSKYTTYIQAKPKLWSKILKHEFKAINHWNFLWFNLLWWTYVSSTTLEFTIQYKSKQDNLKASGWWFKLKLHLFKVCF